MSLYLNPPPDDSVSITKENLSIGVDRMNLHTIYDLNYWHQFIISNVDDLPRDEILHTVLGHVAPLDLIPAHFHKDENKAYFLARSCGPAIEKFCESRLEIPYNGTTNPRTLTLELRLKFSTTKDIQFDVSHNIFKVLQKRMLVPNRYLNLDNLHQDPDLTEFCPLSQTKMMYFVLHLAKQLKPKQVCLSNNRIKNLQPLETLVDSQVRMLDLRNNELEDISVLSALKDYELLTELYLDGNPLCSKFTSTYNYVTAIKVYCKHLEIIDNEPLPKKMPIFRQHYLCNYNTFDIVNNFLQRYYKIFDSDNRAALLHLYGENSMISLNFWTNMNQVTAKWCTRILNKFSRNILKMADLQRRSNYLFTRFQAISDVFKSIKKTQHDLYSMKIDVIHSSDSSCVVVVNGYFKEIEMESHFTTIYSFSRTFVLKFENGELEIMNDMWHINNALNCQLSEAFANADHFIQPVDPVAKTSEEKSHAVHALSQITKLKPDWAIKCLNDAKYDLKKALKIFLELYTKFQIPDEAFLNNNNSQ